MSDPPGSFPAVSDLPAESLGYQAVVAEFYLALRGAGLLLSPLDQELVADWERRGLPVPVVCRGIRQGLATLAEDRPGPVRSLRSLRFAVEAEWRASRSGRGADAPAPEGEDEAAERRLADAGAELARAEEHGGPLREDDGAARRERHARQGASGSPLERVEAGLAEVDARVLAGWLASLPRPERAALGVRARLLAGARRGGESRRAHRETLRAHLRDLGRQAGLSCLRGSV
jgi:hypothetical protein